MNPPAKAPFWRNMLLLLVLTAIIVMRLFPPHAAGTAPSHSSAPANGAPASTAAAPASAAAAGATRAPFGADVGFKSQERLDEHWAKHGGDFASLGIHDAAGYLRAAQALRDAPSGGDILEIVRASDGVISRFDKRTGEFLAFDDRGRIRTFFRPRDGEAYFERQAQRLPETP